MGRYSFTVRLLHPLLLASYWRFRKILDTTSDNRMGQNFLKGIEGDKINALLAGVGANLRKLLKSFWPALLKKGRIITVLQSLSPKLAA